MRVQCPRCGHIRNYVRGVNTQERCNYNGCSRSLTRRHEIQTVPGTDLAGVNK